MFDLIHRTTKRMFAQEGRPKKRFSSRIYAFLSPIVVVALLAVLLPACSSSLSKTPDRTSLTSSARAEQVALKVAAADATATPTAPAAAPTPTAAALSDVSGIVTSDIKPVTFEPAPTVNQGGTCISGYTIDRYHQVRGGGWTVNITGPDGAKLSPITADANGHFRTPDGQKLGAGKYLVELVIPLGWKEYTPTRLEVTLDGEAENTACALIRFKVEALACITVHKVDENGYPGEKIGIPGWKMMISSGGTTQTKETDGVGKAVFHDLVPGTWKIVEEDKVGWTNANGQSSTMTLDLVSPRNPGDCSDIYFTNQQVHDSCIIVHKQDNSGSPLANWTIDLTRKDGTQAPQTRNTDQSGAVYFSNLALGEWIVSERVKDGWRVLGDATRTTNLDTPGTDCDEIVFTNERLGCIDGYKINQLDQGLIGWEITATNQSTKETKSVKTDNNGYYRLNGLEMGVWTVSENSDKYPGWAAVTPSQFDIELTSPDSCVHTRFKNRAPSACIDVYKTDAYDGAGLSDWQIEVQPAYGGDKKFGTTDGTGRTSFYDLVPGEYVVSEGSMDGWEPVGPTSVKLSIEATGSCGVVKFQNRQIGQPPASYSPNPNKPVQSGSCYDNYTVRHGDTLSQIGWRYRVTVDMIMSLNNIGNPNLIYPGMVLCIPPDP
jgi:LysM repeat protein